MHNDTIANILNEVEIPHIWSEIAYEAVKFFLVFSRFEYALKKAGFFIWDGKGKLFPDWKQFCDSINGCCTDDNEYNKCVEYIVRNPPRKQIVSNGGKLDWRSVQGNGNEPRIIIEHIKRIRNNLFHGGKGAPQNHRDNELLRAATCILLIWLEENDDIKEAYIGS